MIEALGWGWLGGWSGREVILLLSMEVGGEILIRSQREGESSGL